MSAEAPPLWRYIALADYEPPPWPAAENVRRGLRAVWRSLRGKAAAPAPVMDPSKLTGLPQALLETVACQQRADALTDALESALGPWLAAPGASQPVRIVVNASHCATPRALATFAQRRHWELLAPPTREQILDGGDAWLAALPKRGDTDCVLPRLDRCFLRHADGLDLLRRLVDWLLGRRGRCLVACNNWAWGFLRTGLGLEAVLPQPFTLAPLGAAELQRWFQVLHTTTTKGLVVFRSAANGQLVLPAPEGPRSGTPWPSEAGTPELLRNLAAGSRGIAGVAWAIWRHSLRVAASDEISEEVRAEAGQDLQSTIWVRSWSELNLPTPPVKTRQSHRFILHALLLHGGLTESCLRLLLPITGALVRQGLCVLKTAGLVEEADGLWQVASTAYPAVRQMLANEEYLVDPL